MVCAAALGASATAEAHQNSVTFVRTTREGRAMTATVRIDALDLNEAIGLPSGRSVTRELATAHGADAQRYVASRLRVSQNGRTCTAAPISSALDERDNGWGLSVVVTYECAFRIEVVDLQYELFFDVDGLHRGMLTAEAGATPVQHIFQYDRRRARVGEATPLGAQLREYLSLGVEHIFTGYDHIAFLVGLLLAAATWGVRRGMRQVVGVVTAFTVAHSLTLIASALGAVSLPSSLVEPAIALSILAVALENLVAREPRARWPLTFGFGLIHGFGFAGVLRELGLPARATVGSLLAFNGGVELGQLAIVLLVFPALAWAMSRAKRPRPWRFAAATALAVMSLYWFTERVSGHMFFGGALG